MLTRSLSVVLSLLAMGLIALAYTLGWQSPSAEPSIVTHIGPSRVERERRALCLQLDDQLQGCDESLQAHLGVPAGRAHLPEKVQRLLAIKERHTLERDALRGCLGAPDAPPTGAAMTRCLGRPTCDAFAACVADLYE